jgi:hypothetical protein
MPTEREVVLPELSNDAAGGVLDTAEAGIADVKDAVIEYTQAVAATFCANYGLDGPNLIISFFPSQEFLDLAEIPVPVHPAEQKRVMQENPELFRRHQELIRTTQEQWRPAKVQSFWIERFPVGLNEVAQDHFKATSPRLQAKYTAEINSWWFRAQGYDHLIDLDAYVLSFLEKLDERLQKQ